MGQIFDHTSPQYGSLFYGENRFNGAFYYSREIVKNIIPRVKTDRPWVTIRVQGMCCDHAIVFVHNNMYPAIYEWMRDYEDLILVCGVPETVEKVGHLGKAIYLPLSIDVREVKKYRTEKTKDVAFVGRRQKRGGIKFPKGTEYLENLPRKILLAEMAKYKRIYAVGRTAIEGIVLGCEVLPYDPRFPDPSVWKVVDNRDAARMLQEMIDEIDGGRHED